MNESGELRGLVKSYNHPALSQTLTGIPLDRVRADLHRPTACGNISNAVTLRETSVL